MTAAKIPIAGQIAEVKRELALRANTYPRLVGSAKMRQAEADLCTARMEAVLATLVFCQEHEAEIRVFIRERREKAGGAPSMTRARSTSKTSSNSGDGHDA